MIGSRIGTKFSFIGSAIGSSSDDEGSFIIPTGGIIAMIGDSNTVGIGDTDKADAAMGVTTQYTSIPFNDRYALGTADPPTWVDLYGNFASGPLKQYAPAGGSGFGFEMTLGPAIVNNYGLIPYLAKQAISGSRTTEWDPSATYPTVGPNIFTQWVARMHQLETTNNTLVKAVVVNLGTNDSLNGTDAGNFSAHMIAIATGIRTAFGAGTPIVWIRTHILTNGGGANVNTVRTAQTTNAGADPNMFLLDCDDGNLLADTLHYAADLYVVIGQRLAKAIMDLRSISQTAVVTKPKVMGFGPADRGAGVLAPMSNGLAINGDLEILYLTTGLLSAAQTTPAGWTLIATVTSTFTSLVQQGSIYSRQITTAMLNANFQHTAATSIPDTNNENACKLILVRGPAVNPLVDVSATSANNANSTSNTLASVTTTAINELILFICGGFSGSVSNNGSITNATVTNLQQLQTSTLTTSPDFQLIVVASGDKATAGATGTSTATTLLNSITTGFTIGIKP
jgi:hypothetical protein